MSDRNFLRSQIQELHNSAGWGGVMVQDANGRGLGLFFYGLVSHRASVTSSAVLFFIVEALCLVMVAAVSCFQFSSFAYGVGPSLRLRWFRVCV